ncbi:HET domain protein, partial [Diaporthe sp. PMI_573]
YASEPLLEKVDSIRLVTVEPELSENGLTSCQLKTTAFARRPKYEALSYRWGDESTKKPILVNGIEMAVTTNLWAALQHFRTNPRGTPVWIDAVSINQSDVAERTRQIQIMPHIYTRASSVVVWLGEEFANVEQNLNVDKAEMATDSDLYERVIADEYWKRVWIRQEIGKGRQVQLLLGSDPVDWERFMHWLSLHNSEITPEGKAKAGTAAGQGDKVGAAVLDHLRSGKYDGSCTLKSLITNHAEAHAKDPRDKIYGLVGLSSDGRGFPMDYKKSLYQVWVDTVRFMSAKKLLPKGPVHRVKFLRTVRAMLNLEETVSDVGAWNHELTNPKEARLAMITAGKTSCDFTPYKFAFVSPQARQGDFVCRLYGYPVKDVLVRAEEGETDSFRRSTETSFHVCGTAVMATEKDPTPNINHEEGRMFTDGSGLQEVVYEFPLRDTFHVKMDATTMYAVIFGNETREEKLRKILEDFRLSNGE